MALSGGEVLVDDGDEVAGIVRALVRGAAREDLLVIEILAIELDAQFLAVVEPECRLLAHATTVSHGVGESRNDGET